MTKIIQPIIRLELNEKVKEEIRKEIQKEIGAITSLDEAKKRLKNLKNNYGFISSEFYKEEMIKALEEYISFYL